MEQVLRADPFFSKKLRHSEVQTQRNRRGVPKRYSKLTVLIVNEFASQGLDAVTMKRHEVIARAFQITEPVTFAI